MTAHDDDDDAIRVSADARALAHLTLDRWLDAAQVAGAAIHERGEAGYIGHISVLAYVDDNGVSLRVERAFIEGLE